MKQSRWSPADLDRQRLVVRGLALRTDLDLLRFEAARNRLVADVRRTLGGPLALIGCFVAGVAVGGREPPLHPRTHAPRRRSQGLVRALLRTLVLGASAYRAFVGSAVISPHTHREDPRDDVAR